MFFNGLLTPQESGQRGKRENVGAGKRPGCPCDDCKHIMGRDPGLISQGLGSGARLGTLELCGRVTGPS